MFNFALPDNDIPTDTTTSGREFAISAAFAYTHVHTGITMKLQTVLH